MTFHSPASASPRDRGAEFWDCLERSSLEMRADSPLRDLAALVRLWRLLRRVRPEVAHGHTPKGGLLAMLAAWLARTPVRVYTMRGLPCMTATGTKRRVLQWSEKLSCRLAHRVLCVSHSISEVAVAERLCPGGKA